MQSLLAYVVMRCGIYPLCEADRKCHFGYMAFQFACLIKTAWQNLALLRLGGAGYKAELLICEDRLGAASDAEPRDGSVWGPIW